MIFKRRLDLKGAVRDSSIFLLGPRGTGKSFWIRETFGNKVLVINLLKIAEFLRLSEHPSLLEEMALEAKSNLIIIDEVQKLPALLDEVHRLIEERGLRFLLTGSSARKLKRGKANLLAGRARLFFLHPLSSSELPEFKLRPYLMWGGLPEVWKVEDRKLYLNSYIDTYLKEEIMAEQAARSLPHFSRFLKTAALCSGQILNFSKVASDAQLPAATVKNYFEALQDTLVGDLLEPWIESRKRKAIQTGKFFFFDVGVRNRLLDWNELGEGSELFGSAFEHFMFMELKAYRSYSKLRESVHFWRSVNHHEVDFILGELALEVKSKKKVSARDAKGLRALREEGAHKKFVVVSQDPINRSEDGIHYLHWREFLSQLWSQQLLRA